MDDALLVQVNQPLQHLRDTPVSDGRGGGAKASVRTPAPYTRS
jgi:hypothetical protein